MFFTLELYVEITNVKRYKVLGTGTEVGGFIYCHSHKGCFNSSAHQGSSQGRKEKTVCMGIEV